MDAGEFDRWFESTIGGETIAEGKEATLREWMLALHRSRGALTREEVDAAFLMDQLALSQEAADAVLADLHRTSSLRPVVTLDIWERSVQFTVGGHSCVPAVFAFPAERAQAFAEVADHLQGEIMEDEHEVWPTCAAHACGLHPEVREDAAVWWCRLGAHALAPVGELPPLSLTRG